MPVHSTGGDLASLLRHRRRHVGLSQKALADLSTVSVRAIRDLEAGRATRPRRETVNLLADGLRIGAAERTALLAAIPGMSVVPVAEPADQPVAMSLPVPSSPIVGRRSELKVLRDLVTGARERLVAIVGVSGVGKTRLAIEFARELHASGDRDVQWVDAGGDESGAVAPSNSQHTIALLRTCIAEMLRAESVDPQLIASLIGQGDVLLVLDGFESTVIPMYSPVVNLLNACPKLQILMTTSDADAATGWSIVPLAPLPVPAAAGDEADADAARLLTRHLRNAGTEVTDADAGTVASICRLVDGVPATLAWVGQWTTVLTLDQLAAELTRDPAALASWPAATGTLYDPAASLRRSFRRLDPCARELLVTMAAADAWSVPNAADRTGRPLCEVARDVHTLLLHGHLRRVETPASHRFVVLRLAGQVALAETRPTRLAARLGGIDRRIPAGRTPQDEPGWGDFVIDRPDGGRGGPHDRAAAAPARGGMNATESIQA